MFLVSYKGWTDEEVYRLGDLSRYTFQQLNEMENKLKTSEQTAEKLEPKIKRIIVSERDLKKISKYLDEGYQPVDKQHQVIKGQIILEVLTIPQMTG